MHYACVMHTIAIATQLPNRFDCDIKRIGIPAAGNAPQVPILSFKAV